ncbi:DMT family transporter [Streptosporangium sp. NPDC000396]|uniref:EamA family transporter n=1 Tax=Streptosporangium sp. NPDC000396 TaxID=3366185 RepID=UPI0036A92C9D
MPLTGPRAVLSEAPPWSYFIGSAVFHYLGPAFAVLLFSRLAPLGVAALRIWSAVLVLALWRRPWRILARLDADGRHTIIAWGAVLAVMNVCFYLAVARVPLGTVAAIEFLPVVALAAFGARTARNVVALVAAVGGVYVLTDIRLAGAPLGFVFAFANAALFAAYIVLAHRVARRLRGADGIDGLAAAMLVASVCVAPMGVWQAASALADPVALAAGVGVGICSSVIPYVCDQLAMARMARSTYALLVSLLPATATVIGIVMLRQFPSPAELAGVGLVVLAVALYRELRAAPHEEGATPLQEGKTECGT